MIQTFKNDHYNPLHFLGICLLDQLRKNRGFLRSVVISHEISLHRQSIKIKYYIAKTSLKNLKIIYLDEKKTLQGWQESIYE